MILANRVCERKLNARKRKLNGQNLLLNEQKRKLTGKWYRICTERGSLIYWKGHLFLR